ncbi:MAG: HEAT repeat domain-containing protein [Armatimonadetes bacterium]|nr:HEAT repeat domain-containing protein [Armatimonadota bacterium]
MAAAVTPETTPNNRTRLYTIGAIVLIVLLIVLYSWYKGNRDAALLQSLQSKDQATRVAAAKTILDNERFVDLILAQPPDVRDAAIVAAEDYANQAGDEADRQVVGALLGLSKGVDREINDPEQKIKDREKAVRTNAWKAIGRIGDVAEPQLLEALKDPSGNVRGAAVEALGVVGAPAVPELVEMLKEPDTRGPAGDALTKIGRPALEPVRPLIHTEGDKKRIRELRLKMASMLGSFDDQTVTPDLLRHIDDTDPGMRRQVIRTLAGLQDQQATMDLIRVMKEDPQVRLDAITALGETRDPRAVDPLVDQFDNYNYDVPANAITALSKIGPPALPRLLKEAKNPNPQIRTYATRGLATIGGPMTVQPLLVAANDPVPTVRAEAVKGMAKFTGPDAVRAVPLLITSFRDPDPEVVSGAESSLAAMGTNPANAEVSAQIVRPLIALYERGSLPQDVYNNRVYHAERVLSQLGEPAIPHLVAAARNGSPNVRKWAVLTLGDMRKDRSQVTVPENVALLRTLAKTGSPEVRWAATDALNRLGVAV